jgi:hypothetical protein
MHWLKYLTPSDCGSPRSAFRLPKVRLLGLLAAGLLAACFRSASEAPDTPPDNGQSGQGILEVTVKR